MRKDQEIQHKGSKKRKKRALSPWVEKFLFPEGKPSETLQMEEYIRSRIHSSAVREFLLPDKEV